MSKQKKKKPAELGSFGVIVWAVVILAAIVGTVLLCSGIGTPDPNTDHTNVATGTFAPVDPDPTVKIEDLQDVQISTEKSLVITDIGSYSGIYMEDGSDAVLSRILMVVVKNTGSRTVQYAEVELTDGEKTACFSLSTLPPGESAVLLEKNRMPYAEGKELTEAKVKNVAMFPTEPTLCEDQLKIQGLDGVLNVTNISGKDIAGDVVIYYKNASSDMLYGGITYRITITGGIKADEVKQIVASHFSAKGSRIMWVTVA